MMGITAFTQLVKGSVLAGAIAATGVPSARALRATFAPYTFPNTVPAPVGTASDLSVDFFLDRSVDDVKQTDKAIALETSKIYTPNAHQSYKCVLQWQDPKSGAQAYAFRSIDATGALGNELRLIFPGRSHGLRSTTPENTTAVGVFKGGRSAQIAPMEQFFNTKILPYLESNPGLSPQIFGHSLGSGSALHVKHLFDLQGRSVKTTLFEPFAAAHEAGYIVKDSLSTVKNAGEQDVRGRQILDRLRSNVTSIYSFPPTMIRELQVGNTTTGNMLFGEKALVLNGQKDGSHAPVDPYRTGKIEGAMGGVLGAFAVAAGTTFLGNMLGLSSFSKGKLCGTAGIMLPAAVAVGSAGGGLLYEAMHEELHALTRPAAILEHSGDAALSRNTDPSILASNDHILYSRNYPINHAQRISRDIAIAVTDNISR